MYEVGASPLDEGLGGWIRKAVNECVGCSAQ